MKQTIHVPEKDAQGKKTGALVPKEIEKRANEASAAAVHAYAWAAQELNVQRVRRATHTRIKTATEDHNKAKREADRLATPATLKKLKTRERLDGVDETGGEL